jgi:hypothetical protein
LQALILAGPRRVDPRVRFFTVDTVLQRRLYVLVFLSLSSRRIEYFSCTSKPDAIWDVDDRDRQVRFLIPLPR